jgi:hypothetical protein
MEAMKEKTIAERWGLLNSQREAKLERSRRCATLTVPSLLPPEGWTEEDQLPQPYSSVSARGVMNMASRILSAMLPLNDAPFFRFELATGIEPTGEVYNYLESLAYQVHSKLSTRNLRESIYTALQHLIVLGDVLIIQEDTMSFRIVRTDQYVCRRTVEGDIKEIIYIEFIPTENTEPAVGAVYGQGYQETREGYRTHFMRLTVEEDGTWNYRREDGEGTKVEEGSYDVSPFIPLRWSAVSGENYGRSHCEDIIGDIQTLESFTEALIEGTAAGSAFWIAVDPAGITELDDIAGTSNGGFVAARQQDVFTLSPSATMNPQIQATQSGVETMRREVGNAFLLSGSAIPSGDRVTATAVRMIGSELETVLGGAFSAIARDLMEPIVKRTVFLMLNNEEIDPRLAEQFNEDGILTVEIVTGLQALSRDTDLQKLMQMGEMVRNLPEQALMLFRWEEYARALVTSIGFDAGNWIKSEAEVQQEQAQQAKQQQALQLQGQMAQGVGQAATDTVQGIAQQDMAETGGQNIGELIGDPAIQQQLQAAMGMGGA